MKTMIQPGSAPQKQSPRRENVPTGESPPEKGGQQYFSRDVSVTFPGLVLDHSSPIIISIQGKQPSRDSLCHLRLLGRRILGTLIYTMRITVPANQLC